MGFSFGDPIFNNISLINALFPILLLLVTAIIFLVTFRKKDLTSKVFLSIIFLIVYSILFPNFVSYNGRSCCHSLEWFADRVNHKALVYFSKHKDGLPSEYSLHSDDVERRVVDYIAGMTDQYASRKAEELSLIV